MSGSTGLLFMAAVGAALLIGMVWGVKLEESANRRAARRAATRRGRAVKDSASAQPEADKPGESPQRKRLTASKLIAFWMLGLTTMVSAATLYLMRLCIVRSFTGALYPLSGLITLCQAGNAVVLAAITNKSKAENVKGGITYDAALGTAKAAAPDSDAASIFDTV